MFQSTSFFFSLLLTICQLRQLYATANIDTVKTRRQIEHLCFLDDIVGATSTAACTSAKILLRELRKSPGQSIDLSGCNFAWRGDDLPGRLGEILGADLEEVNGSLIGEKNVAKVCLAAELLLCDIVKSRKDASHTSKEHFLQRRKVDPEKEIIIQAMMENRKVKHTLTTSAQRCYDLYCRVYRRFRKLKIRVCSSVGGPLIHSATVDITQSPQCLIDEMQREKACSLFLNDQKKLHFMQKSKLIPIENVGESYVMCGVLPPAVYLYYL